MHVYTLVWLKSDWIWFLIVGLKHLDYSSVRLVFLKRLYRLLKTFYQSVVARGLFFAVVCLWSGIKTGEVNRLNKLVRLQPDSPETVAVFRQSTKPPICPSFWRLGPPIFRFGGYTYFRLACYLKMRRKCAGLCMRWAEVSMTCTAVRPTTEEF